MSASWRGTEMLADHPQLCQTLYDLPEVTKQESFPKAKQPDPPLR